MQALLELPLHEMHPTLSCLVECHAALQERLPRVDRFSKYQKEGYGGDPSYPGVRPQNSLQHVVSVGLTARWLLAELRPWLPGNFDEALILRAISIHEDGEMEKIHQQRIREKLESMGDTHYIDKNDDDDLVEYQLFREYIAGLSPRVQEEFTRDFLLQFAFSGRENFPEDAQVHMRDLKEKRRYECLFFQVVERWDYFVYALEQYIVRGNKIILVQVARNQFKYFDSYRDSVGGFSEEVWMPELRSWVHQLLITRSGQWLE